MTKAARDAGFGLFVLALVVGGVLWVRGSASTSVTGYDATPDVTREDGVVNRGDVRITMSVSPRPPVAFTKTRVRIGVTTNGAPRTLENGRITFSMTMPMGDHRYSLTPAADGWLQADVVLPLCDSGDPRWYARVEGTVAREPVTVRFRLDLARHR